MPGSNLNYSTGAGVVGNQAAAAGAGAATGAATGSMLWGFPTGAYVQAALGLAQAVGTGIQNAKINDIQSYKDYYTDFGNQVYTGDFNSLIQQRRSANPIKVPSWGTIRGMTKGARIGSALTSIGQGAMAGSGFGPIGMGIGAAVGGLSSLAGTIAGNKKADRAQSELNEDYANAIENNHIGFLTGIENENQNIRFLANSNISAFGGPLDFSYPISGAIDYDFAQRRLAQKDMEIENEKALGGPLHSHGTDWSNGITLVGNGGTHEQNPFEGVPMGIAPDGQPNLVEEGEVIFNDYVFSNRLKVPEAIRNKYKLRGTKGMTFADAAKKAQKESEERPNDPISQRGLEDIMSKLMVEQEAIREKKQQRKFADGGDIHIAPSKRGTFTAAASKHNMGVQEFASKVLANPEDYSPAMRKKANFARNASKWKHAAGGHLYSLGDYLDYLDAPEVSYTEPTSYPVVVQDPYGPESYGVDLDFLQRTNTQDSSGLGKAYRNGKDITNGEKRKSWFNPTWLRYAPVVTGAIGLFQSLKKPDYSNAKRIETAAHNIRRIDAPTIGNYVKKRQFDTLFYANQLAAQAAATRRAILNNSNGNRMTAIAGLLGADMNAQNALGNLYRKGEEFNAEWDLRGEGFNRETNLANAENSLRAQIANGELDTKTVQFLAEAAKIREQEDAARMAAISANLTNLGDNLGNIGREEVFKRWINENPALLYAIGNGGIGYKRAKGGYLTIKKRRK